MVTILLTNAPQKIATTVKLPTQAAVQSTICSHFSAAGTGGREDAAAVTLGAGPSSTAGVLEHFLIALQHRNADRAETTV